VGIDMHRVPCADSSEQMMCGETPTGASPIIKRTTLE